MPGRKRCVRNRHGRISTFHTLGAGPGPDGRLSKREISVRHDDYADRILVCSPAATDLCKGLLGEATGQDVIDQGLGDGVGDIGIDKASSGCRLPSLHTSDNFACR